MYKEYFGFTHPPFSIAPDPRYLYMSKQHEEALAHLYYGSETNGAFVVLTGEVGAGKTTVCRCFIDKLPENIVTAFVHNPMLNSEELLASICDELDIEYDDQRLSVKSLVDALNIRLLENNCNGLKTIIVIDEAQNLRPEVLEQLRLITNLETNNEKLLQVFMIGQPELREILDQSDLKQLSQRITARYHLKAIKKTEIGTYIRYRMEVAGVNYPIFKSQTYRQIYRYCKGIPRLINLLCDRALLAAYSQNKQIVDRKLIRKTHAEMRRASKPQKSFKEWLKQSNYFIVKSASVAAASILIMVGAFYIAQDLTRKDGYIKSVIQQTGLGMFDGLAKMDSYFESIVNSRGGNLAKQQNIGSLHIDNNFINGEGNSAGLLATVGEVEGGNVVNSGEIIRQSPKVRKESQRIAFNAMISQWPIDEQELSRIEKLSKARSYNPCREVRKHGF